MHPAYEGLSGMPFYDEFDLSTVDVLLISQYVLCSSLRRLRFWFGGLAAHHGFCKWWTGMARPSRKLYIRNNGINLHTRSALVMCHASTLCTLEMSLLPLLHPSFKC
jgi:hypothetical protein